MHTLIISSYLLQGSLLVEALKRQNIKSSPFLPQSLSPQWHPETDAIIFPHFIDDEEWELIETFLKEIHLRTPLIFLDEGHRDLFNRKSFYPFLDHSIFLNKDISLEQTAIILKDIIQRNHEKQYKEQQFEMGGIILDRRERSLIQKNKKTTLTKKEFFLLELLMLNAGHVISRERIIDYVWDKRDYIAQNTIDVYISRLRKKLEKKKFMIQTVPCLGYTFKL